MQTHENFFILILANRDVTLRFGFAPLNFNRR